MGAILFAIGGLRFYFGVSCSVVVGLHATAVNSITPTCGDRVALNQSLSTKTSPSDRRLLTFGGGMKIILMRIPFRELRP